MKTVEVVLNLSGENPLSISTVAKKALDSMTGNPNFSNPFPSLTDVQTDITNLDAAILAAKDGSKAAMADLRAKTRKLVQALKALVAYVQYASHDDEQVALSSGFSLKKGRMLPVKTFTARQGLLSGTAELSVKRASGSTAYLWQFTKDPIGLTAWADAGVTVQAHQTVTGLTPLTTYWFRVAVVTKDGQQNWSDPYHLSVI